MEDPNLSLACDLELIDKTALISGSTKGIGFAIASQLAAEGARVIVNGRSDDAVNFALEQVRKAVHEAKVEGFAGDLSTTTATEDLLNLFPAVDILVNNLGIYERKPFDDLSDEDWRHVFEVNVLSGVRLSRAYVSGMKQRNWGRIIFISSESGIFTPEEMIHYGMTKNAQPAVSRGLVEYCGGTGVTVNSILPGPTHSDGLEDFVTQFGGGQSFEAFEKEFFKSVRPSSLIKRFETPDEIARLVTFVCSPVASAINGAPLRVDGGVVSYVSNGQCLAQNEP
jgi:NAD(P)-dependent dehydrogenase (short-subunit alcohol dehydrogenase family)